MDLGYGPEYEAFREEVASFLAEHWPPRDAPGGGSAREQKQERERAFRLKAIERGYLYRNIPKRYGGSEQEPDVLAGQILREEFRRARAPMEVPGNGTSMLVPTLLERGEEWQKERFVPKTVTGEYRWCQGYSEPGSGSDLASVQTRGELDGDEWVINGQKIWTTQARESQFMFALVRTEPDAPKHAGISYLLIPMDQPGVEVQPLRQINGAADFNQVFLTDARAPADWIVGARGEGWRVSRTTLKHERNNIGSATQSVQLFKSLLRLAREVERDGQPAVRDPVIQDQLVELQGHVYAQLYSSYVQLSRDTAGRDPGPIATMNKLISTNLSQQAADIGHELLGNDGLLDPLAGVRSTGRAGREKWTNQFMGSLAMGLGGGTSNIHRNVIAERCLGLPRDFALWKDADE